MNISLDWLSEFLPGAIDPEQAADALMRGGLPVYPPIAGPPDPDTLARMCDGIVGAGLDGAMLAGLETASDDQLRVARKHLSEHLV